MRIQVVWGIRFPPQLICAPKFDCGEEIVQTFEQCLGAWWQIHKFARWWTPWTKVETGPKWRYLHCASSASTLTADKRDYSVAGIPCHDRQDLVPGPSHHLKKLWAYFGKCFWWTGPTLGLTQDIHSNQFAMLPSLPSALQKLRFQNFWKLTHQNQHLSCTIAREHTLWTRNLGRRQQWLSYLCFAMLYN